MEDWRERLSRVVSAWDLAPEDQKNVADELEAHLEQQLAELTPRVGERLALERIVAEIDDPALRAGRIRPRHRPAPTVDASRRSGGGWDGLVRDVRYGWRTLTRTPGTTAMATLALALGIGLTTVMFSIIYGTLVRGLPYEDGSRIVMVMRSTPVDGRDEILPMHEFFAIRDAQRSFDGFGAYLGSTVNLSGDDQPERASATRITAGAMTLPRVQPMLGRLVQPQDEDPSSALVAVLSFNLWRERYASDSAAIGRRLTVNGVPATIVGVMPEGFDFPMASRLWVPLRLDAMLPWGAGPPVNGVGRLAAGVSLDRANAELAAIAARIDAEHRRPKYRAEASAIPFVRASVRSQVYTLLYAMFFAVSLVLVIACVNVANLLLARASARSREIAVRRALGASAGAVARQTLVEALLLTLLAAGLGALLAQAGITVFRFITAGQFPFFSDIRLHPPVFAFIALAAAAASVLSGSLPALHVARSDPADVLKDQSLGSSSWRKGRLSRGLVVLELALSSALLIVTALTTKSLTNLLAVQPGFRTEQVLTGRLTLASRDTANNAALMERLEQELGQVPGVAAASLSTGLPGTGWGQIPAVPDGQTMASGERRPMARHLAVTSGFFKTFDVTVVKGRAIGSEDRRGAPRVALVNERFARERFAGADPIGRRINVSNIDTMPRWVTVVGVFQRLYAQSMQDAWPVEVITAFQQETQASATIALHTTALPAAAAQSLRARVTAIDSDLPVYAIASMQDVMKQSTWAVRVFGGLFAVFGMVALVLACIGLYAVLAFAVRQRERELGIRMALGAAKRDVVRLVLGVGARQLLIGVPIGLVLGVGAAQAARAAFFGVRPTDPIALIVVVGTLAATGFLACLAPAIHATRADPIQSLRSE